MSTKERSNNTQKSTIGSDKNALEWSVFAFSLLLVLAIIGYLSYKTITHEISPPDLVLEYTPDPSEHAPYRYHVIILNAGGETAEEVNIELSLEKGGEELEAAELQVPFSPKGSRREGWVNFKTDPAEADTIIARVMSYKRP